MIYPLERKNLEKVMISKNHSKHVFFSFLGNKVDFLSSDHMRLWASSPQFWHVDKTEAAPGEREFRIHGSKHMFSMPIFMVSQPN